MYLHEIQQEQDRAITRQFLTEWESYEKDKLYDAPQAPYKPVQPDYYSVGLRGLGWAELKRREKIQRLRDGSMLLLCFAYGLVLSVGLFIVIGDLL